MRKIWGNLKSDKRRDGVQNAIKTKAINDIKKLEELVKDQF